MLYCVRLKKYNLAALALQHIFCLHSRLTPGLSRSRKGKNLRGQALDKKICAAAFLLGALSLGSQDMDAAEQKKEVKNARLVLVADFLYWTAAEEGLDFSYKAQGTPGELPAKDVKIAEFSQPWNTGFRVGLGYRFPHDCWQAKGYVTQFRTTNPADISAKPGAFIMPNLGQLPGFTSFVCSSGNWHLKYTLFDLELLRSFFPSKALALTPFLGARFAWINQNVHVRFPKSSEGNTATLDLKGHNNYGGGGLRLGSNGQFFLAKYVSFFGSCAFSLLSGHFDVKTHVNSKTATLFSGEGKPHRLRANCELRAGAQGTIPLYREQAFLTLGLTYDMVFWFAQNQLLNFFSSGSALDVRHGSGDLTLQGISVCTRLDF